MASSGGLGRGGRGALLLKVLKFISLHVNLDMVFLIWGSLIYSV